MKYKTILTEIHSKTYLIKLNRPGHMNAINEEMTEELYNALRIADEDNNIKCIIISGSDTIFAAGADINEFDDNLKRYKEENIEFFIAKWPLYMNDIKKPIIAAISGYALGGGCELALLCDIRIASDSAKFSQPEILLGLMPGGGATKRLPKIIGKSHAMELCLTGKIINANEAYRIGLVNSLHKKENLIEEALKISSKISKMSLKSILSIKKSIKDCEYEKFKLEPADLKNERELFYSLFDTKDSIEGIKAFKEKRNPNFLDK